MKIQEMFSKKIDRPINGVIQVEQKNDDVINQEIKEYVVTSELKKHFTSFFNEYSDSFDNPTDNTGVWITGFFGSGKSHFLKMLSYILENKEIDGKKTIEYFREKFNDELTFMPIEKSTSVPTETILFNIDVEGSMQKDDTAVLKVFARVFYDHLGFYGRDLKLAKLEQYISKQGKYDEFKKMFEEKHGESWEESRDSYAFFEDDIVDTLNEVLGMSKESAQHWFDGTETADISIGQLVEEIKEYVESKPKNFRLLFMIDEAGQYIGTSTSMLLNLQSLIEKLGSECRGQVWVIATGQEALDDMIKLRTDEFSRIMARFKVRLSLTSSSVGEVIEKRLLDKKDNAKKDLEEVYTNNESVIKNLYSFDTEVKDIKGYRSSDEFVRQFPFVSYQFNIMQKIFNEIRKHGHAGKHQASGERSMLNGFQESAIRIMNKDEFAVVPLYSFYDTLHSFLDTSVRGVIERADRAADNSEGLKKEDVNTLKLLYLIRYVDDIKSNIENISILMADDIRVDKLELKENVTNSLERLISQNYVARNGDIYTFLTDEEQDISRDIKNTVVDTATIVSKIGETIFDDIYTAKKVKYSRYDFAYDQFVDGTQIGTSRGDMQLRFMTVAADPNDLQEMKLIMDSKSNNIAICVLSDQYKYFENLETSEKIRKYVKQKNINQLPASVQKIIQDKQTEANRLAREATEEIAKAIVDGKYYIDGEVVSLAGTDAKNKINKALECLVEHTYKNLNMVDGFVDADSDIKAILNKADGIVPGMEPNKQACDEVYKFLQVKASMHQTVSMYDIQSRYEIAPYGWREIDIAAVIARLIVDQKVIIKHSGSPVLSSDYRIVDYLRKQTEVGNTIVVIREGIGASKLKQVKDFLREYFDVMDLPDDEDGLFEFISKKFAEQKTKLDGYSYKYQEHQYPGRTQVDTAKDLVGGILFKQADNVALIDEIIATSDDLLDSKDDMKAVDNFFTTQVALYDNAIGYLNSIKTEKDYYSSQDEVNDTITKIENITRVVDNYNYNNIKDLNGLISSIKTIRSKLIDSKAKEVIDVIEQCKRIIQEKANEDSGKLANLCTEALLNLENKKEETNKLDSLALLDAKKQMIFGYKDNVIQDMESILKPQPSTTVPKSGKVREMYRNVIFDTKIIRNETDIDNYLAQMKEKLKEALKDNDELRIK